MVQAAKTNKGGDVDEVIRQEMQKFREYCEREFGSGLDKYEKIRSQIAEDKITSARVIVVSMGVDNPNNRRKAYKELRRILDIAGVDPKEFEVHHRKIREHVMLLPKSLEEILRNKLEEQRRVKRAVLVPLPNGGFKQEHVVEYRW